MDNKITKKRLSDFLAYEWILMIFLCAIAIVVWELIYTVSAVRLSVGQDYKFFYDKNMVYGDNYTALVKELDIQEDLGYVNGKTFSYEIQKIGVESVLSNNDLLSLRLSVQEGDMLFTDSKEREYENEGVKYTESLAKSRVDNFEIPIITFEEMLEAAKSYLGGLLLEGKTEIAKENLDPQKIQAEFNDRLGGDNRFRSSTEKATGVALEKARLEKLCDEVNAFEKLMELPDEYFFTYTRFEQSLNTQKVQKNPNQANIDDYQELYDHEVTENRKNARYGFNVGKLKTTPDKKDVSNFFSVAGEENDVSQYAVIMVIDFLEDQPALQFESIVVINNIVRACSTILD